MNNRRLIWLALLLACMTGPGAMRGMAQRQMENIGRGLVAVKTGNGVFLSWRMFALDNESVTYNLYRNDTLVNDNPVRGLSNYTDPEGSESDSYHLETVTDDTLVAVFSPVAVWGQNSLTIPLQTPSGYTPNDASIGDLDGDGEYELIVKMEGATHDNAQSGYTDPVFLHAYEFDGTFLWSINLGINIRGGAHYTQFMVYDLDGDGKAEVACKTAPGTKDASGAYLSEGPAAGDDDEADYRNGSGYILSGPEYLTVFDGATGLELTTVDYIPPRAPLSSWGDTYGNRVDRFLACVAYLDGKRPSLVMCRGYYDRTTLTAWDFKDGELTRRWAFDTETDQTNLRQYENQGSHSISVGDVDFDGRDEIMYGAEAFDDDGTPLYNTQFNHGDATHLSDLIPSDPGLEFYMPSETAGSTYDGVLNPSVHVRDAGTGEVIWKIPFAGTVDVGRAMTADITAAFPGNEFWAAGSLGVYNSKGEKINGPIPPINFAAWWDGDLLREMLDGVTISKWNEGTLQLGYGCASNNGTKSTPALSGDILGDWREEVIWRTNDNKNLRLYTTTIPTQYGIYTLLQDPQYRLALTWQNVAYNQPPHPGFFIGYDMSTPPLPPVIQAKLTWKSGSQWDLASANWMDGEAAAVFQDGDDVLFDFSGSAASPVSLDGTLNPSRVSFYALQDYTLEGPGSLAGSMSLYKAGKGSLTLNNTNSFTGVTRVRGGNLFLNGELQQSHTLVYAGGTAGGSGTYGMGMTLNPRGELSPGTGKPATDTLRIAGKLLTEKESVIRFDLSDDSSGLTSANDVLMVDGDLVMRGGSLIDVHPLYGTLEQGEYTLIHYTGSFTGDLDSIDCNGMEIFPYTLLDNGKAIILNVTKLRGPARITWEGGDPNNWDLAVSMNWINQGTPDLFVTGDTVVFNDEGISNSQVNLVSLLPAGRVQIEAGGDYFLSGSGVLTGSCDLVKNGSGSLKLEGEHEFTGAVRVNEGTLEIEEMVDGGIPGALGASSADASNLILDGGTLKLKGQSSLSNRGITLAGNGGTIYLATTLSALNLSGTISGTGLLTKTGQGELTLSGTSDWSGGMLVKSGTLRLGSEEANIGGLGSGKITLENSSLYMLNDGNTDTEDCDWDLVIPAGTESWLYLDRQCSLKGTLEGGGVLNLDIPYVRSELNGDWSAFSGKISPSTGASTAWFLPGSQSGFENAALELTDNIIMLYANSEDAVIRIGEIHGLEGSELGSGGSASNLVTWEIGALNSNSEIDGLISNRQYSNSGASASIIKVGTGNLTFTGPNTYSGGTEVKAGILEILNTEGSATGSGQVIVRSGGAIRGKGAIGGPLTLESQASLTIGTGPEVDEFTVNGDMVFESGSFLSVKLNTDDKTADKLIVNGYLQLGGILFVTRQGSADYIANETYRIISADSAGGAFTSIIPSSPGEGLVWDMRWLASDGLLRIATEGTIGVEDLKDEMNISVYPNPANSMVNIRMDGINADAGILLECYDQQGRVVMQELIHRYGTYISTIDVSSWSPGLYNVVIFGGNERYIRYFILN